MARSERHGNTPRDSAPLKGMACGPLLAWRSERAIHQLAGEFLRRKCYQARLDKHADMGSHPWSLHHPRTARRAIPTAGFLLVLRRGPLTGCGNPRRLGADFFASRFTPGIPRLGIFALHGWMLGYFGLPGWLVWCWFFHKWWIQVAYSCRRNVLANSSNNFPTLERSLNSARVISRDFALSSSNTLTCAVAKAAS